MDFEKVKAIYDASIAFTVIPGEPLTYDWSTDTDVSSGWSWPKFGLAIGVSGGIVLLGVLAVAALRGHGKSKSGVVA